MARITNFHTWITTLLQFHPSPLPGMLVLEGPPGSGKTLLVQEWLTSLSTQKASPAITAHHILAKKQETPAQFARRLAEDLEWFPSARSTSELWNEAARALTYNSVNLLIIDQAEQLSLMLAQCIRSYLFDDQICTLLLVGSSALMTTLHRDPALEGRVLPWHTITDFDSPNNSIIAIKEH
ncbi:hypothetical protein KSC_026900 [Ktedonobacter sp. SOSP1-52]|uniref:ATP-binding protein n=1 Tax=Ktedonobacter sp. SOSP1-52 TaxID=2778366 RepID=UPI00191629DC|nr:ATP-binding protein [Ktedonobacter sp. SOSP1-52]GHO63798.1 hypothetical protein KSC_026900 [Ktedonobacter sp. SOSP1-52]